CFRSCFCCSIGGPYDAGGLPQTGVGKSTAVRHVGGSRVAHGNGPEPIWSAFAPERRATPPNRERHCQYHDVPPEDDLAGQSYGVLSKKPPLAIVVLSASFL